MLSATNITTKGCATDSFRVEVWYPSLTDFQRSIIDILFFLNHH